MPRLSMEEQDRGYRRLHYSIPAVVDKVQPEADRYEFAISKSLGSRSLFDDKPALGKSRQLSLSDVSSHASNRGFRPPNHVSKGESQLDSVITSRQN